jgi:hypothetical protein
VHYKTGFAGGLAVGALVALGVSVPLARGDAKPGTIGVGEIHEKMKGYGLTVFQGTTPERFDVEVIGVLHNFRPGQDLILVKTPHPRLNIVKTVAGMSGSPIFIDGRLAGAYAYSLSAFESEPVAGVTPIGSMLTEMDRPVPPGFWPIDGAAPLPTRPSARPERHAALEHGSTSFDGAPGGYDLKEHAAQLAARLGTRSGNTYVPASTPLLLAGVGDRTAQMMRSLFEPLGLDPLQTGGGQGPVAGTPQHFVDGGAIGVQLVRGDVSFMGLGTVTHVVGTKLCAFGHPMFNGGDAALPTTIGRVLWINASDQRSFKVGESASPPQGLGTLVQDRQSAIVIDETMTAPVFPVSVDVKGADGAPKKSWHMDVAEERFMSPSFTAAAIGAVVEATVSEQRDMTWLMRSKLSVRGHGAIELEDFGVAIGGMPEAGELSRSRIVSAVGELLNNPWEHVRVERVESHLAVEYTRDLWRLRGVELLDEAVDAGEKARIKLHFFPFAGPEVIKEIEVRMPPELAGKEAEVELLPGYEVAPEVASPENLSELIANQTRQSLLPRSVVAQVRVLSQGVLFHGHVAPRLPAFALDVLRPTHSDTGPDAFLSYERTVVPLDKYIQGRDKVKVKVRNVVR